MASRSAREGAYETIRSRIITMDLKPGDELNDRELAQELGIKAGDKVKVSSKRGFIKAEVVNYQDLLDCGTYTAAKEKGLVRMEGKEYVVKDGDVVLFRFNV